MIYVVYAIHIITCIFLILVVLLQQGKGADLSVFGGGTTQAAFGARGAATLLHKLTVAFFILFLFTTLSIGILQRQRRGSSVMQELEAAPQAAPAEAPIPEAPAPPPEEPAGEGSTAPVPGALDGQPSEPADPGAAPVPETAPADPTSPQGSASPQDSEPPPSSSP